MTNKLNDDQIMRHKDSLSYLRLWYKFFLTIFHIVPIKFNYKLSDKVV